MTSLTCSRKAIGRRHFSHSSSGSDGRPFWLSHAGFPPILLGNCGESSRHGSASSRNPRTTSADNALLSLDIVGTKLSVCHANNMRYNHNTITQHNPWSGGTIHKSVRVESRCAGVSFRLSRTDFLDWLMFYKGYYLVQIHLLYIIYILYTTTWSL